MDDLKRKRFLWGILLAWLPWIPVLTFFYVAFKETSEQKATGIAAVAGSLAEVFSVFGLGIALAFAVSAIVFLLRAFAPGHWLRTSFTVVSICLSLLLISLFGLCFWLFSFIFRGRH